MITSGLFVQDSEASSLQYPSHHSVDTDGIQLHESTMSSHTSLTSKLFLQNSASRE